MTASLVSMANARVPMTVACRAAGLDIPDSCRDTGTKCYCPWGEFSHSDGGREKAARIWPDHLWCFSCREWYSPVKLCARVWEVSYEQAAVRLLDAVGYKPASYAHLWQRAAAPEEVSYAALSQALRNFCMSLGGSHRLTEPLAAEYLARCLGYLTQVNSEAEAAQWLSLAKTVMERVLTGAANAAQTAE